MHRLTQSARNKYFEDLYEKVLSRIDPEIQEKMAASLEPSESGTTDYDWMKSPPGKLGMKTIFTEIKKLERIREFRIEKRIYPHLFRHQLLTFLTQKGILAAKIQLISGHEDRKSLAIYEDLNLADVEKEYREAMRDFPVK